MPPSATSAVTESMPFLLTILNGEEPYAPMPPGAVSKNTSPIFRPSPYLSVSIFSSVSCVPGAPPLKEISKTLPVPAS